MAVAEVVAPKVVVAKVADQLEVAVAKGMAVDGPVEQAIYPVEGAAMHRLAVGKSKSGTGNSVEWYCPQAALVGPFCCFAAVAANHVKH